MANELKEIPYEEWPEDLKKGLSDLIGRAIGPIAGGLLPMVGLHSHHDESPPTICENADEVIIRVPNKYKGKNILILYEGD